MSTLALTVRSIETLEAIKLKLRARKRLSIVEKTILGDFLNGLPSANMFLHENFPLDEHFEVEIFDIKQMTPYINKWLTLFNKLPKQFSKFGIHAGWLEAENDPDFWRREIVIEASFIPSLAYSRRNDPDKREVGLNLRAAGTAMFEFCTIDDADNFPELYNFQGSWREAYLLVLKTLKQGWPQTKFPEEFEALLKD